MTLPAAFFTLHRDLPREGPGAPDDVGFAAMLAGLPESAVIADAGCGPGGDIAALLAAAPDARVVALDLHQPFVDQARARFAGQPNVAFRCTDMADLASETAAPFDMIWCAGALYFLGLTKGLAAFRAALKPDGILAFSEPCHFTDNPSKAAHDFWDGYATRLKADILSETRAAGYEILGHRPVSDAGWEGYFRPLQARIAQLGPDANADLAEILDLAADEASNWRDVKAETGYLVVVARKTT